MFPFNVIYYGHRQDQKIGKRQNLLKKVIPTVFLAILCAISPVILTSPQVQGNTKTIIVPDDYSTITAALENACDGDTIFLRRGVYSETIIINKAISLVGENKESTIINGHLSGTVILVQNDYVNITGITVMYDSSPAEAYDSSQSTTRVGQHWIWGTRLPGIHLLTSNHCNVYNNKVINCGAGIWIYDSRGNNIFNNTITHNTYGIRLEASANNNLANNTVVNNSFGILLVASSCNNLTRNKMQSNNRSFGIENEKVSSSPDYVDTTNTVDGRPIYYWVGISDKVIPTDAGFVILVNCSNIIVQGLSLEGNEQGVILAGTQNITVINNVMKHIEIGIVTYNSFIDRIIGNEINPSLTGINAHGIGTQILNNKVVSGAASSIHTYGSLQTIAYNQIESDSAGVMLRVLGSQTNVTGNTFSCRSALVMIDGPNNVFYNNNLVNCSGLQVNSSGNFVVNNSVIESGLFIRGSSNNVYANTVTQGSRINIAGQNNVNYANNIITNGDQANYYNAISWDNGTMGNYWSDYNGTDLNSDGIGDEPYTILQKEFDHVLEKWVLVEVYDNYPLIKPFNTSILTLPTVPTPTIQSTASPTPTQATPTPTQQPTPTAIPTNLPTQTKPASSDLQLDIGWTVLAVVVIVVCLAISVTLRKHQYTSKKSCDCL